MAIARSGGVRYGKRLTVIALAISLIALNAPGMVGEATAGKGAARARSRTPVRAMLRGAGRFFSHPIRTMRALRRLNERNRQRRRNQTDDRGNADKHRHRAVAHLSRARSGLFARLRSGASRTLRRLTPNGPNRLVPLAEVEPGMHVMTPRFLRLWPGFIRHHGVVVDRGQVISKVRGGTVEARDLAKSPYAVNGYVRVRDHAHTRSVAKIIRDARAKVGNKIYYTLAKNCEHFAERLITGRGYSRQYRFYNAVFAGLPGLVVRFSQSFRRGQGKAAHANASRAEQKRPDQRRGQTYGESASLEKSADQRRGRWARVAKGLIAPGGWAVRGVQAALRTGLWLPFAPLRLVDRTFDAADRVLLAPFRLLDAPFERFDSHRLNPLQRVDQRFARFDQQFQRIGDRMLNRRAPATAELALHPAMQ